MLTLSVPVPMTLTRSQGHRVVRKEKKHFVVVVFSHLSPKRSCWNFARYSLFMCWCVGSDHVWPWLIEFSGVALTCFTLARSTVFTEVSPIKSEDSVILLFKAILYQFTVMGRLAKYSILKSSQPQMVTSRRSWVRKFVNSGRDRLKEFSVLQSQRRCTLVSTTHVFASTTLRWVRCAR